MQTRRNPFRNKHYIPHGNPGQSSIERMLAELMAHKSKIDPFHYFEEESPFLRGYQLQRGYLLREENEDVTLKYHGGEVYPGIGRSTHNQGRLGYSYLALRIRTTDEEFDHRLIGELQKRGVGVEAYPESGEHLGVTVSLEKGEKGSYYKIMAQGVPSHDLEDVKGTMDSVGKVLLQAKELVQKKGEDSEELAKELFSGPPKLHIMFYSEYESPEVAEAIRGLAASYLSQPGIFNRPLISLFEAGELADSALGADKASLAGLRECVRRQVGWVFQGGSFTAMDFSRVFHRICDAMGIPPITD